MSEIEVSDTVRITVKRQEFVAQVLKIEAGIATCSFYMPRSKGMSLVKIPLIQLTKTNEG